MTIQTILKKFYIFAIILGLVVSIDGFCAEKRLHNYKETPLGYFDDKPDVCKGRYVQQLKDAEEEPITLERIGEVKDQGPLGICVSCAVGSCFECLSTTFKVSIAEFTVLAETHLGEEDGGDCIAGLFLGGALDLSVRMGFIAERRLPYPFYVKYVACKNGINVEEIGWEKELEDLIRANERVGQELQICFRQDGNPTHSYNITMEDIETVLRLYNNPKIDITSHRLGCIYLIHHISPEDLTSVLERNRCKLPRGTVGLPGRANIDVIRHALKEGYPVAIALGVTNEYQYVQDFYDTKKRVQYYKKVQMRSDWDGGKSTIAIPQGCYRDSNIDKPIKFDDDEERVFGADYLSLLQKALFELGGFHAIVLTGFDDTEKYFNFINSWGIKWGYNGLANIFYNYIEFFATEVYAVDR